MDANFIDKIYDDTDYVRWGGSSDELRCAQYLQSLLNDWHVDSKLESFSVPMAMISKAKLTVLEPEVYEIECAAYFGCKDTDDEGLVGELYYLQNRDKYSLSQCRGKIVLVDGYLGRWLYKDLLDNGAIGFITYNGNVNYPDCDVEQRELRDFVSQGNLLSGAGINVKDAVSLVKKGVSKVKLECKQDVYEGESHNVVCKIDGNRSEEIVFTAHYDTVDKTCGAYDNMSGSIGLLGLVDKFRNVKPNYTLRFIWCGSEERGLLGSKAYVKDHKDELDNVKLCINLDMIGSTMGKFLACCTSEEKLVHYIEYLACIEGFDMNAYQDVYSSDSTPFADAGVPAVSFARMANSSCADFHCRYDNRDIISEKQLLADIEFICTFTDKMANAKVLPVSKEMPEKMKEELDYYLLRKRKQ